MEARSRGRLPVTPISVGRASGSLGVKPQLARLLAHFVKVGERSVLVMRFRSPQLWRANGERLALRLGVSVRLAPEPPCRRACGSDGRNPVAIIREAARSGPLEVAPRGFENWSPARREAWVALRVPGRVARTAAGRYDRAAGELPLPTYLGRSRPLPSAIRGSRHPAVQRRRQPAGARNHAGVPSRRLTRGSLTPLSSGSTAPKRQARRQPW